MQLNRYDIAAIIASRITGYRIVDVDAIMNEMENVICEVLESGNDVKLHKLIKLSVEESEAHKAYDGINKTYYQTEPKKWVKTTKLIMLDRVEDRLNGGKDNG